MVPSLADESALLSELRGLAESGRYRQVIERLGAFPRAVVEDQVLLALLAAEAQGRLGDHDGAERWATSALELARRRHDPQAELRATHYLGAIAWQRGNADEAETHFQRALELARTLDDPAAEARAFNNLGILHDLRGETQAALSTYHLALASYQQAGNRRGMAETHHNMSISWKALGMPTRARQAAEEAERLAQQVGDATLVGLALVGRAVADLAMGDAALAAAELDRAAVTYQTVGFIAGLPEVQRVQAAVARARGDLAGAVRLLTQAAGSESAGAPLHTQAEIERDLGDALAARGDPDGARAARERALALFRRLGAGQAAAAVAGLLAAPE